MSTMSPATLGPPQPWFLCSSTDFSTDAFDHLHYLEKSAEVRRGEQDAQNLGITVVGLPNASYEIRIPIGGQVVSTKPDLEAAAKKIHDYQHGRRPALMAWYHWMNQVARIKVLDHLARTQATTKEMPQRQ